MAQRFPAPPAPFNMAAYVLEAGLATPEAPALEIVGGAAGEVWNHAQIRAAVGGVAAGLLDSGLRAGDRVLMRQGNSVAFPITFLACIWAGLIPVPTAAALTAPEVEVLIASVSPSAIVAGRDIPVPQTTLPVIAEADLTAWYDQPGSDPTMGDPERLGYIVFTSGSGGVPKAVCHAHRAVWARRMMWEGWYDLRPSDRMLHAGAFNWTYTLGTGLMDPWAIGATALIPAAGVAPADLPTLLARHGVTLFAAAPGVYRQALRGEVPPLPALRHGLSAGEALPAATRAAWEAATGCAVHEALGMSECSTFISGSPARPAPEGAAGFVQRGRVVRVLDSGHLAVGRDDPGLMLGYWENGAVRPVGAWFDTGDLVDIGAEGAVRYLGRGDDMMNAGGFRVSPLEVEGKLRAVRGVSDIGVVAVSPREGVEVIAAFHVGGSEAALRTAAQAGLARYKQPRIYVPLDALPRNANGKLNRRALRDLQVWRAQLNR